MKAEEKNTSDRNEKDLDKLLDMAGDIRETTDINEDQQKRAMKKIESGIARNIYWRITKFLLVLTAVLAAGFFAVSQLSYINRFDPQKSVNFQLEDQFGDAPEFSLLLQTFSDMFMPESYLYMAGPMKKTGFGNYELDADFGLVDKGYKGGSTNGVVCIKNDEMSLEFNDGTRFYPMSYPLPFTSGETPQALTKRIEELPDSAYVAASIVFREPKSIAQMYDYTSVYREDSRFYYLATYVGEHTPQVPMGLGLIRIAGYDVGGAFGEAYPKLYYDLSREENLDVSAVVDCYHSRLRLLLDNPEFLDMAIGLFENMDGQKQELKDKMSQELNKGAEEITFLACRGSFKKKDMLDILADENVAMVRVHKVSLSGFSDESVRFDN